MKRTAAVLTALCLALCLAGCGKTGGSTTETPGTDDSPSVTEPAGGTEAQSDTEEPSGTEAQSGTEEPSGTEAQSGTEEPSGTEAQSGTEEPSGTEAQSGTEEPSGTEERTEQQGGDAPEFAPPEEVSAENPPKSSQAELQEEEYIAPSDSDITGAIIAHNHEFFPDAEFEAASYVVYATGGSAEDDSIMMVYLMALYQGYDFPNGNPEMVCAASGPAALTFRRTGNAFQLIDYWTPEDGEEYLPSLRETFPSTIPEEDLDTQKYIAQLTAECDAQAEDYVRNWTG